MANLAPYIRSEERPFKMAKRAANGKWHSILVSCGIEAHFLTNVHKPCPGCDGKDRFRFDDLNGDGTFYCSNYEKQSGDGFALLQHVHSIDSKEALKRVLLLVGSATPLSVAGKRV